MPSPPKGEARYMLFEELIESVRGTLGRGSNQLNSVILRVSWFQKSAREAGSKPGTVAPLVFCIF